MGMSATDTTTRAPARAPDREAPETVELDVTGMTCGSCAARVQRALSRQEGVTEALVNYATGRATVELAPGAPDTDALVRAVEQAGYGASPAAASASEQARVLAAHEESDARDQRNLLRRIVVAVPLAAAITILTYAQPHEPTARWIVAAMAVPVQFWCGLPFLRSAWARARARSTNMDTLIALSTLASLRLLDRDAADGGGRPTATASRGRPLQHAALATTWARSSSRHC